MTVKKALVRAVIAIGATASLAILPALPASAVTQYATLNSAMGSAGSGTIHWSTKRTHQDAGPIAFKADPTMETCGTTIKNRLRSGSLGTSAPLSIWSPIVFNGAYNNLTNVALGTNYVAGQAFYLSTTWSGAICATTMYLKGTLKY